MMQRTRKMLLAIGIIGCLLFFTSVADCQEMVKMIFVKGSPKVLKAGETAWSDCTVELNVASGDRIKTLKDEAVEISFAQDNANVVRINENSDMVVRTGTTIELLNGEVMSLIKKLPKDSLFEVKTPAGISGARGTGWRSETTGERSRFDAFEGSIFTKGVDASGAEMPGELIVENGWRTTVDRFEAPAKLERLSGEDIDRWNGWKEDVTNRLDARVEQVSQEKQGKGEGSGTISAATEKNEAVNRTEATAESLQEKEDRTTDATAKTDIADKEGRLKKLDSAASRVENIETRKEAVTETRDSDRIDQRLEEETTKPPPTDTDNTASTTH